MLKVDLDYYGKTYGFDIKRRQVEFLKKTDWERRKFLVDKLVDAGEIEKPDSAFGLFSKSSATNVLKRHRSFWSCKWCRSY